MKEREQRVASAPIGQVKLSEVDQFKTALFPNISQKLFSAFTFCL